MAQYWINSIDWECEQNLPEETEVMDGLHYPFIIEAPENASEKDIIRALYDKKVDEDVEVNVEGFYEFSIAGVDYESVKEKAKDAAAYREGNFGGEFTAMGDVTVARARSPKALIKAIADKIESNNEFYASTEVYATEFLKEVEGAEFSEFLKDPNEEEFDFDKTIEAIWKGLPGDDYGDDYDYLWVHFVKDVKADDAKAKAADENFGLERESDFRELEEEVEDITTELMESLQTDFRDLKDLVRRGDKRQDLVVQLIRKHLIPNLKELADLLDQSKAG